MHRVPTLVWGRDELGTGEMWNSNSVIAWLLAGTGGSAMEPPVGGRAPGWAAGLVAVDFSQVVRSRRPASSTLFRDQWHFRITDPQADPEVTLEEGP